MSTPRRWARRAVLALAGSGLTAAGVGGTFAGGALGAEAPASTTGASESPSPPVTETSPQAPTPSQGGVDPSTTTSTTPPPSSASTTPASGSTAPSNTSTVPSGTATAPSAPAADTQQAPMVVVQRSQRTTSGRRRGASVTGSGKGGATGGGQVGSGATGKGEGAAQSAPGTVPAGTPNGVAPAPQTAGGEPNPALPTLATLLSGSAVSAQALDFYRIPLFLLPVYQAAAFQYDVPWQILAAINEVETDYGTDLSVSTAGAVGWMQFMPATWLRYGVDATSAGYADPYNPVDAIFAAARYLHAAGASHDLRGAILAYNHSQEYAESVLLRARLIASYPRTVIATLTGLVDGRLPTAGARLAPGMGAGLAAETAPAGPNGSAAASSSLSTGNSAAGGPSSATAGAAPAGAPPSPLAVGAQAVGSAATAHSSRAGSGAARATAGVGGGVGGVPGSKPPPPPRVAAARAQEAANAPAKRSQLSEILGAPNAPVVAVEDGRIVHLGRSHMLGRYLVLRDIYGDVFTYAGLGSIAPRYRPIVPREDRLGLADVSGDASASSSSQGGGAIQGGSVQAGSARAASAGGEPVQDPAPTLPASAGHQSPLTLKVKAHAPHPLAPVSAPVEPEGENAPAGMGRVRLFAHPSNPIARAIAARSARSTGAGRGGWRALRAGSIVSQGTVLGHLDTPTGANAGTLRFAVRPAGDNGTIDPQPLLANWRQLGVALHPKGSRATATLLGATAQDALEMSKGELQSAVLSDPGIQLDACGRRDVASGAVDRRVLAVLEFLSRSGLQPTVGALRCPPGGDSPAGLSVASSADAASTLRAVSSLRAEAHRDGYAVDISAINGIPIAGHQGPGTVTDAAIRTLLALRGQFAPHRIVSLMSYPEDPSTQALATAWDHIHIGFLPPHPAVARAAARDHPSAAAPLAVTGDLSEAQWSQLIARIAALPKPTVAVAPSSAAIRDPQAAPTNRGLGARGLAAGG
jgi:hypothetical protein